MRRLPAFILYGVYGFLPFWAATVIILGGARAAGTSEYWLTAPWLWILAIPYSLPTLAVAHVTAAVFAGTEGETRLRMGLTGLTFIVGNLLLLVAFYVFHFNRILG